MFDPSLTPMPGATPPTRPQKRNDPQPIHMSGEQHEIHMARLTAYRDMLLEIVALQHQAVMLAQQIGEVVG